MLCFPSLPRVSTTRRLTYMLWLESWPPLRVNRRHKHQARTFLWSRGCATLFFSLSPLSRNKRAHCSCHLLPPPSSSARRLRCLHYSDNRLIIFFETATLSILWTPQVRESLCSFTFFVCVHLPALIVPAFSFLAMWLTMDANHLHFDLFAF